MAKVSTEAGRRLSGLKVVEPKIWRATVKGALVASLGKVAAAAVSLGIKRRHLWRWIKEDPTLLDNTGHISRQRPLTVFENMADVRGETGFVYFVDSNNGFVKIGYSKSPMKRLFHLQCASPVELKMRGFFPGSLDTEKKIHKKLSAFHANREWFRSSPEVDELFANEMVLAVERQRKINASQYGQQLPSATPDAAPSNAQPQPQPQPTLSVHIAEIVDPANGRAT